MILFFPQKIKSVSIIERKYDTEFFFKICTDHPLIEYIEDPFVENDLLGYQKILKKFKDHMPRVKIGVKNWFKSNLDLIKLVRLIFLILNSTLKL